MRDKSNIDRFVWDTITFQGNGTDVKLGPKKEIHYKTGDTVIVSGSVVRIERVFVIHNAKYYDYKGRKQDGTGSLFFQEGEIE